MSSVPAERDGTVPETETLSLWVCHSRTGSDEKKGKTQEKMERGSRKRSSSAGSEKMESVGGR